MANEQKEKKQRLWDGAVAVNPELAKAKTWIKAMVIMWVLSRVVLVALQAYCTGQAYLVDTGGASNYVGVATMVLFAIGIVGGAKGLAILPMVGAALMIVQTFTGDFGIMLNPAYAIPIALRLYAAMFVLASYGQIALMLLILLPKKCRAYFSVMETINKQITSGTLELPKQ